MDTYTINVPGESFNLNGNVDVQVYSETDLEREIQGPAIIKFDYTSVLVPDGFKSDILADGILSIVKEGEDE